MTRRFTLVPVPPPVFNEIAQVLTATRHAHAFTTTEEGPVIDLHGLAFRPADH